MVGSRINEKSSFDAPYIINSDTLKMLYTPQKQKEKVELRMSAKTSADDEGQAVPTVKINEGLDSEITLNNDYMDAEFNDSPFDLNGSALFWMW